MKIVLIRSLNPYYESSASGNRFAGIIDGLLKQGVKVTLVVTGGYIYFSEYKEIRKKVLVDNLNIFYTITAFNHNLFFRRINVFLLSGLFGFLSRIKLRRFFKSNYDFIWLTNDANILDAFIKYYKLIKGKSIIELNEFNDMYLEEGQFGNFLQKKKAKEFNKYFLNAINKIDLFAVMTQILIKHYKPMAKNDAKFFHFPMTVNMSRFTTISDTNIYKKPYIAYTGTFNNKKDGVDILIHSFAKISKIYTGYHLYLAGFYHYDVQKQKELINKYELNDRITYIGTLNKFQVPEFIQNAKLLVLSRPDSHQAKGGFPTKLGEYLATGVPVCVTKVGEIPNYLEDNVSAFMAEPGSIDSFADALQRALSNIENANRIGLNGKKVAAEHFSIDVQIEKLCSFFNSSL